MEFSPESPYLVQMGLTPIASAYIPLLVQLLVYPSPLCRLYNPGHLRCFSGKDCVGFLKLKTGHDFDLRGGKC